MIAPKKLKNKDKKKLSRSMWETTQIIEDLSSLGGDDSGEEMDSEGDRIIEELKE